MKVPDAAKDVMQHAHNTQRLPKALIKMSYADHDRNVQLLVQAMA